MATKPKAGAAKKKAVKPKDKEVSKAQGERFIETARELGVDESGALFEAASRVILRTKKR